MRRKWTLTKINEELYNKNLKEVTYLNPLSLRILAAKGITSKKEIHDIVFKTIRDFDFFNNVIKDTEKACEILKEGREKDEEIIIYGDYDCDGVTATIVAMKALSYLGFKVDYYINDRIKQGYGMKESGIDEILEKHPNTKIILTVDNGISAHEPVKYAKEKGLTVIVTDHHETQATLPEADAIVNHQRHDDPFGFKGLCGAGVIWRVFMYYFIKNKLDLDFMYSLLDIVALGTVADVVPLIDENRAIVKEGLRLMNDPNRVSKHFNILKTVTNNFKVTSETLGFSFAPMVNAVGRMEENMRKVVDFFLEESVDKAAIMAQYLSDLNAERKEISATQCGQAELKLCITIDDIELSTPPYLNAKRAIDCLSEHIGFGRQILVYGKNNLDSVIATYTAYKSLKNMYVDVEYVLDEDLYLEEIDEDVRLILATSDLPEATLKKCKESNIDVIQFSNTKNFKSDNAIVISPYNEEDELFMAKQSVSLMLWWVITGFIYAFDNRIYLEYKDAHMSFLEVVGLTTDIDPQNLTGENKVFAREGLNTVIYYPSKAMSLFKNALKVSHFTPEIYLVLLRDVLTKLCLNLETARNLINLFCEETELIRNSIFNRIPLDGSVPYCDLQSINLNIKPELKKIEKVIIVASRDFGDGIIGLISGRLKEKYNRPALAFHVGETAMKGSGRSIESFHLKEVLDRCADLLLGYGGHKLAAGLSVAPEKFDSFCERINSIAEEMLTEEDLVRVVPYVAEIREEDINQDLIQAISVLEPYGEGFRAPLFKINNIEVSDSKSMKDIHLKILSSKGTTILAWKNYDIYAQMGCPKKIMGIGVPSINVFQGQEVSQFIIDGDNFYKK